MLARGRKLHSIKHAAPSLAVVFATIFLSAPVVAMDAQSVGSMTLGVLANGSAPDSVYSQLERIDEGELAELRGGLSIGGFEMDFGATLQTLVDNIQLTTAYQISEAGIRVLSETLGTVTREDAVQAKSDATARTTPITGSGGVAIPVTISSLRGPVASDIAAEIATTHGSQPTSGVGQPAAGSAPSVGVPGVEARLVGPSAGVKVTDLAPADVSLAGVEGYRGLVINDTKGFTAALHDITQQAIISALVSTASDRKISQHLEVDVRLQNIGEVRAAAIRAAVANRVGQGR